MHEDDRIALAFVEKGDLDVAVIECRHVEFRSVNAGGTF